jgi:hypothetical protein
MLNLSLSLSLILDTFLFNEAEPNIARLSSCILHMLVSKRVDCLILLFFVPIHIKYVCVSRYGIINDNYELLPVHLWYNSYIYQ